MKLIQIKGPFVAGQVITVPAQQNYKYIHIGIQIPKRQPIQYTNKTYFLPDLTINNKEYIINEYGILEFDGLAELAWVIKLNKNMPMEAIIDIAYDIQED